MRLFPYLEDTSFGPSLLAFLAGVEWYSGGTISKGCWKWNKTPQMDEQQGSFEYLKAYNFLVIQASNAKLLGRLCEVNKASLTIFNLNRDTSWSMYLTDSFVLLSLVGQTLRKKWNNNPVKLRHLAQKTSIGKSSQDKPGRLRTSTIIYRPRDTMYATLTVIELWQIRCWSTFRIPKHFSSFSTALELIIFR